MTFGLREREREMAISIPIFGNGNVNVNGKFHSHFREQECKTIENSIPDFRERKIPGNSREIPGKIQENFIPIYGNGNANGKFHSHFRERECEWQIPFPTFGTGIGGRYSREFPGSGIPAHGWPESTCSTSPASGSCTFLNQRFCEACCQLLSRTD